MSQEAEENRLCRESDSEEESPYQFMIVNDFEKINVNINISQMEQWSILNNVMNNVQYNRSPNDYYKLDIRALEPKNNNRIYDSLEEDDRQVIDLDFTETPVKLKGGHLDCV